MKASEIRKPKVQDPKAWHQEVRTPECSEGVEPRRSTFGDFLESSENNCRTTYWNMSAALIRNLNEIVNHEKPKIP